MRQYKKTKRKLIGKDSIPKKKARKQSDFDSPIEERFFNKAKELGLVLQNKHRVDKFIADFSYTMKDGRIILIELDGKKWHRESQEQTNNDYSRQRYLTKKGYIVVRFTGSEIYRKCEKCIQELIDIINSLDRGI